MAEEKQLTGEEKEERRTSQLSILKDKKMRMFPAALAGKNESQFGQIGKTSTYFEAQRVIQNPSKNVSEILANVLFPNVKPEEMYENSLSSAETLKALASFYFGGLNYVRASDVMDLMGSEVSEGVFSLEEQSMYMEDLAKSNKKAYETLIGFYQNYVSTVGVGEAIVRQGKAQAGSLEQLLAQKE